MRLTSNLCVMVDFYHEFLSILNYNVVFISNFSICREIVSNSLSPRTHFQIYIRAFMFCIHIIFLLLSEPHYLLLFHDIFDCTHKAHRLMNHDTFDCTAMPFFYCATLFLFSARMLIIRSITIFCLHRDANFDASPYFCFITSAHRSERHDILFHHVCLSFGVSRYF